MKIKFLIVVALLLFSGKADSETVSYRALEGELNAYICIERPKNLGLLNAVPAKVIFSNEQNIILFGGDAGCVLVRPGKYSFNIISPNPYPSYPAVDTADSLWKSEKIEVDISKDQMVVFKLVPSLNDEGRRRGKWQLEKIR